MSYTKRSMDLDDGSMVRILNHALVDINYLLVEGFDTNSKDCEIPGVKDTIQELQQALSTLHSRL